MAGSNTELKAKVKLDTTGVKKGLLTIEKQTNRLNKIFNKINNGVNSSTNSMNKLNHATRQGASNAEKMAKGFQKSNSAVSALTKNLRTLISTYVGIMGLKAVANQSDIITSSKNMLNNLAGGSPELTQQTMDKVYAAAQRSRGDYSSMLSNVGKSMTLAGAAFQGNVDNAVRFQEIMSKAYTIGGASSAEQSSSMYQMIQALGSGTLQGDELRSVREGAPIAYKKIEEFAQGVLHTEESLKELASQGRITSDMVVAAIMSAEKEINTAFKNTDMTFAQAGNSIKNTALKVFTPVLERLNKLLNGTAGQKALTGITNCLIKLADAAMWAIDVLESFFTWCSDNWYWLKDVVVFAVSVIISYLTIMAAYHTWTALVAIASFVAQHFAISLVITAIALLITWLFKWAETTQTLCDFITEVCLTIAKAIIGVLGVVLLTFLATGVIIIGTTALIVLIIIGIILLLVAAFLMYTEQIVGAVYVAGAFIYDLVVGVVNGVIQIVATVCDPILSVIEWILNVANGGFNSFTGMVANLIGQIISWFLSLGKVVTLIIDAIFGTDWTAGLNSLQDSVLSWGKNETAITLNREAPTVASMTGLPSRIAYGDAWDSGTATGANIHNSITAFGESMKSKLHGVNDFLNGKVKTPDSLIDPNDPAYALDGAYDPSKALGDIADDTDSISKNMDLTYEDLSYLRKIAEKEWKKEYTTAEIRVDMTNYNTINDGNDLDGLFTKLSEELCEELNIGANGVYA